MEHGIQLNIFGKARILQEDDEIYHAIETLGLKYNEDEVTVEKEIQREWKALCCIEITIEHISGKQAIELVNKKSARKSTFILSIQK